MGDAHMSYAKNNIDSALDISVIVKANSYGRKGQMKMSDTNKLRLKDTTANLMDLDEFTELYGEYMIVGFEYGGEIMFSATHTVRSHEDKLKVAAGLSTHFNIAGFSLGAKVDTNYKSSDTSKMSSVETHQLIRPNIQSDDVT